MDDLLTPSSDLPSTADQWCMTIDATAESRAFVLRALLPGWAVKRIGRTGYATATPPDGKREARVNLLDAAAINGHEWHSFGTIDALAVALAVAWEVRRG